MAVPQSRERKRGEPGVEEADIGPTRLGELGGLGARMFRWEKSGLARRAQRTPRKTRMGWLSADSAWRAWWPWRENISTFSCSERSRIEDEHEHEHEHEGRGR